MESYEDAQYVGEFLLPLPTVKWNFRVLQVLLHFPQISEPQGTLKGRHAAGFLASPIA